MWKNTAESDTPQMIKWSLRIACWIPKATNTHSEYVILIAFARQECLRERASMLRFHVHFLSCQPFGLRY